MQGEPHDGLVERITDILADLIASAASQDGEREVHCIMITCSPGTGGEGSPGEDEPPPIEYELIESGEYWYITAVIPPVPGQPLFVDIRKDSVRIFAGLREAVIQLGGKADLPRSFYDIRHGLVDITVHKCQKKAA